MRDFRTTKCLICLKPATIYTGHVILGKMHVIAGWCEKHSHCLVPCTEHYARHQGCHGGWLNEYGLEEDV